MDLADIFFRKMVITMSYKLKALFFKPKSIKYSYEKAKNNYEKLSVNSADRIDMLSRDIPDDVLLDRLNNNLKQHEESISNYFEIICLSIAFVSFVFQIGLIFQLWNYQNLGFLRYFILNMFIGPICVYMFISKKNLEKSLLDECSHIYGTLKKRNVL